MRAALPPLKGTLGLLQLFLLLQEDRHHDRLKWPWPRGHHAGLHLELGVIEESVKDGLIPFRKGPFERGPAAAFKLLKRDRKVPRSLRTLDQALRVSWRIVKDWVEAQRAIVDTTMVALEQVLLPYAITPDGRTLYERLRATYFVLPPAESQEI
jgi:hypothetical protein